MHKEEFPKIPAPLPKTNPWVQPKQDSQEDNAIKIRSQIFLSLRETQRKPNIRFQEKQAAQRYNGPTTINNTPNQMEADISAQPQESNTREQQVIKIKRENQVNDVISEFQKLNSVINLEKILEAVHSLSNMLQNCKTPIKRFQAFSKFAENIDSYGF